MKKIILELDDNEYKTFKGRYPELPVDESITLGRTLVRVKITEPKSQETSVNEEDVVIKEEEEKESFEPADVNKDGKVDLKDVGAVAGTAISKATGKSGKKKKK